MKNDLAVKIVKNRIKEVKENINLFLSPQRRGEAEGFAEEIFCVTGFRNSYQRLLRRTLQGWVMLLYK